MNQPGEAAGSSPQAAVPALPADRPSPVSRTDRIPALAWVIGGVFVAAELAVSGRYGFQQDELYFIVAGRHLAFGYVDQPPLVPLLSRITDVLGVSPTAIRIIPALAAGAVVVIAARLAALFGAGRFGRVLAALATACTPIVIGATHIGNTTPPDLLAWAAVLLCVSTALLRHRPHWWLGAGAAAGAGLENNDLMVMLLAGLALGILVSEHRPVLRTRWPWLGAGIAAVIWAPNLIWQATHGWPQLAMASALHQQNTSVADYLGGLPAQLVYLGLLVIPLTIAGFIRLWRAPELRFIAVAATVIVVYVLAWVPGKVYYADGMAPAVLAAGSLAAERWIARGRRPRLRRGVVIAAPLAGMVLIHRLRRSPPARALRPQRLLDVGAGPGLGPHRARGGRARPAAAGLRQLPPADHLPRPVPRAQRLDRHPDRRLHRPGGQLAHAVAAPEALRLIISS